MEPVNFTARVTEGRCEAIGPSQNPRFLRALVAAALGLDPSAVSVEHTRIGGGFGRRLAVDYGVEAALVARTLPGRWVQVVWTREDDLGQDYYRPPSVHALRAGLASDGRLVAWDHHLVTSSLAGHTFGPGAEEPAVYDVQGADCVPLEAPWIRLGHSSVEVPLQLGSLRSVAHSFNVFAVASFLDEIAELRGVDPLAFQRELIGRPRRVEIPLALSGRRGLVAIDAGRLRRVVDVAAERAGWGASRARSDGLGLAWSVYKGTYVAHVAHVEAGASGSPRVTRVTAAVDCGTIVDRDGVRAQAEGAVVDGMATVLHWRIGYRDGRPTATNFDGFPLLRMSEAPEVDVVLAPSGDSPTGMGEPPYPSVAPAITSALFAATGRRHRRLPIGQP
jgi:isoquinoline 1-oxidoreductase beta subunit